jgi:protein SCO1
MRVRAIFWVLLGCTCLGTLIFAAIRQPTVPVVVQAHWEMPPSATEMTILLLHVTDTEGLPVNGARVHSNAYMTNMTMPPVGISVTAQPGGDYLVRLPLYMAGPSLFQSRHQVLPRAIKHFMYRYHNMIKHTISSYRLSLTASLLAMMLIGLLAGCGSVSSAAQNSNQNGLQGTSLGGSAAPNFHLADQNGHAVSLAQFRGMPVILTFFYTHCPNFCPLIAQKIHTALDIMGSDGQKVAVIGISVDPEHDTKADAQAFAQDHGLASYTHWHYLLGTRSQLSPVWTAYHVAGLPPSVQVISASQMIHSSVVYLIDRQGREQALLDYNFTPAEMASDMKILLG